MNTLILYIVQFYSIVWTGPVSLIYPSTHDEFPGSFHFGVIRNDAAINVHGLISGVGAYVPNTYFVTIIPFSCLVQRIQPTTLGSSPRFACRILNSMCPALAGSGTCLKWQNSRFRGEWAERFSKQLIVVAFLPPFFPDGFCRGFVHATLKPDFCTTALCWLSWSKCTKDQQLESSHGNAGSEFSFPKKEKATHGVLLSCGLHI